jgi:hypothetical protein
MATDDNPSDPRKIIDEVERRNKTELEREIAEADESARIRAQEKLDILQKQNEALREQEAILKKLLREQTEFEEKLQEAQAKRTEQLENQLASTNRGIAQEAKTRLDSIQAEEDAVNASIQRTKQEIALAKQDVELLQDAVESTQSDVGSDPLAEAMQKLKESGGASDELKKKLGSLQSVMGDTFGMSGGGVLGSAYRSLSSFGKILEQSGAKIVELGGGTGVGQLAKGFRIFATNTISGMVMPALAGLAFFLVKTAMEVDGLSKNLAKSSAGASREFSNSIFEISQRTIRAGIGFREASEAIGAMQDGLSSFNPNNINQGVAETVARLKELNVGAADSVKIIDHFQKTGLAASADAAGDMARDLALAGRQVGITTKKMVADFASVQSRLAAFGSDSIKVFKELQGIVKETGLAITDLTEMASGFDKFDTAADSVAKMNSILQTQLSTVDLMNMTDAQRIITITEEVKSRVGANFESMNMYEKRLIAQAMGLKDVAKAQRLLNADTKEFSRLTAEMDATKTGQAELQTITEALVPLTQRLKLAFMNLFLKVGPLLEGMVYLINGFVTGITNPYVLGSLSALAVAMGIYALNSVTAAAAMAAMGWGVVVLAITAFVTWIGLASEATDDLHDSLTRPGSPPLYLLPGVLASGFEMATSAIKATKDAMGGAIDALGGLYNIFHKPGSPMLYALPLAFAGGFISIGESVAKATAQLNEFVSLMLKVAQLDFKGFIALRTDSSGTSMVMGSESVLTSISEGKLRVDVNMPEFTMPEVHVKVFIGKEELKGMIRKESSLVAKKTLLGRA